MAVSGFTMYQISVYFKKVVGDGEAYRNLSNDVCKISL